MSTAAPSRPKPHTRSGPNWTEPVALLRKAARGEPMSPAQIARLWGEPKEQIEAEERSALEKLRKGLWGER